VTETTKHRAESNGNSRTLIQCSFPVQSLVGLRGQFASPYLEHHWALLALHLAHLVTTHRPGLSDVRLHEANGDQFGIPSAGNGTLAASASWSCFLRKAVGAGIMGGG
jgi:hypothetical protein